MVTTKAGFGSARTAHAGELALAETLASLGGPAPARTEPAPTLPTGGDRFEASGLLGEGGMGRVHLARDLQFGRDVALKELADGAASVEGARRFVIEALVTGNLEHPGIPAVYERGMRDGRPFYAMRRVDGRPMSAVIAEARTLEARLALLPAIVQVANTLGFAHAHGVVHRDIKPDNVLLAKHGEVVVVDWGIAKVRGADDDSDSPPPGPVALEGSGGTEHGAVLGTPAYMAPEQARGEVESVDARTDVFALGAMLYHVLTGRAPYEGPTSMASLTAALEARREPLEHLAPDVPAGLRAIVDRAMATAPSERFADADELARALGAFMTDAVAHRPSVLGRVVVGVASALVLVTTTLGTVALLASIPGLPQQGGPGILYASLSAAGLLLLATEWLTRGRHRLLPLVRSIAAAVLLTGLGGACAGVGISARATSTQLETDPSSAPAPLFLEGLWESSGSAAGGAQLAALLVVLAALLERRLAPAPADST